MASQSPASVQPWRDDVFVCVHPHAAGVDIGSEELVVAVPPERDTPPVRVFRAFTADLDDLVAWLLQCRIDTVAMESTGVYGIPLYGPARTPRDRPGARQPPPCHHRAGPENRLKRRPMAPKAPYLWAVAGIVPS